MYIKQFTVSMILNDNRVPPQPATYHCDIEAEFLSIDYALSFHEDLVKLIAEYRSPMLVTQEPVNVNKEND